MFVSRILAFVALTFLAVSCNGFDSDIMPPPPVLKTPLDIDPEDPIELSQWWSDGARMLRLDPDNGYVLIDSQNRYDAPADRGRWSRDSYAFLSLSPYESLRPRRIRATITRIGDTAALKIGDLPPLISIDAPPPVLEDKLIGSWMDADATLHLDADRSYLWSPTRQSKPPYVVASHRGQWIVAENGVVLSPLTDTPQPLRLELVATDDGLTLVAPKSVLRRIDE